MIKALVLTGFGINCEEEMAAAYRLAGAEAQIAHFNEVLYQQVSIHDFDILNFPGGFSFGDDLSSGKVMANKIRFKKLPNGKTLLEEIKQFIADGKYIMGVCNGFQMLVRLGLLPNVGLSFEQEATLSYNDSARFEDRWCYCKVDANSPTPFLKGLDVLPLPIRHGEGKLIVGTEETKNALLDKHLNCLTYAHADGSTATEYPANPNGSDLACAGLCDTTGQVFGLMPHPEAFLSMYNHPNWGQLKRQGELNTEEGYGLQMFKNIVNHITASKELV